MLQIEAFIDEVLATTIWSIYQLKNLKFKDEFNYLKITNQKINIGDQ